MQEKKAARLRRARRGRAKMRELGAIRLAVYRTPRHIYAQLLAPAGDRVLAQASTLEKAFDGEATGNAGAAGKVGALVAARGREQGITKVAFDRSGFNFHGRIKALADAAREAGLEF